MEITNFLTAEALITFTMTIVLVELWCSFTKELPLIKKMPTKFYTFILAIVHLAIINIQANLFVANVVGIYTLLCNALVLTVVLNGGYDILTKRITINKEDK